MVVVGESEREPHSGFS